MSHDEIHVPCQRKERKSKVLFIEFDIIYRYRTVSSSPAASPPEPRPRGLVARRPPTPDAAVAHIRLGLKQTVGTVAVPLTQSTRPPHRRLPKGYAADDHRAVCTV